MTLSWRCRRGLVPRRHVPVRSSLPPGTPLDGFEITPCSGVSATGFIHSARDRRLARTLTVREYMPVGLAQRLRNEAVPRIGAKLAFDAGLRRFMSDAQRLQRTPHPSLVQIERLHQEGGTAYLVMPAHAARSLSESFGAVPPTLHARRVASSPGCVASAMPWRPCTARPTCRTARSSRRGCASTSRAGCCSARPAARAGRSPRPCRRRSTCAAPGTRPRTVDQWLVSIGLCDRRSRRRLAGESLLLQTAGTGAVAPRPPPQWAPERCGARAA